jgi:hypothetical protein
MSQLWVEIEQLVFDGVTLDPAKGRRVATLTEATLERLLRERGISAAMRGDGGSADLEQRNRRAEMQSPPAADEARWADALAKVLYRTIDRSV